MAEEQHGFLGSVNRAAGLLTIGSVLVALAGGIISVTWTVSSHYGEMQNSLNKIQDNQASGQANLKQAIDGLGALSAHVRSIDDQLAGLTVGRTEQATQQAASHDAVLQLSGQVTALQAEVVSLQGHISSAEVAVLGLSKDVSDIRCKLWPAQCPPRFHDTSP